MRLPIGPAELRAVGSDLVRPECVLTSSDGRLFCSDGRGGVMCIAPDGTQSLLGPGDKLVPNGIARLPNGEFLIANVGSDGGVWHLSAEGQARKLAIEIDGRALPEINFVYVDKAGRLWLCVSSAGDHDPVFTPNADEGYIVLGDEQGFRTVTSGLGWTNELRVNATGDRLFVNETFGRRLLQFDLAPDGSLSNRTVLAQFGAGDYPDGMALDCEGGIWVVSIISNRIYRLVDGLVTLMFSDGKAEVVDHLETLLNGNGLRRSDLKGLQTGTVVNNISSIAFGGQDLQTAYVGSLERPMSMVL